jgi:hypothetical protein
MYPARYPEVIAVGAIDPFGNLATFNNTGGEIDVLAPGTNILSLDLGSGAGTCSGTSMAVPHVTAVVAMMLARNPQLAPEQIKSILVNTAVNGEINLAAVLATVGSADGWMSSNTVNDSTTASFDTSPTLNDPINTHDTVDIIEARYRWIIKRLIVDAESDKTGGDVVLTVEVRYADNTTEILGDLDYDPNEAIYSGRFRNVSRKPVSITVISSGGGSDTIEL